MLHAPLPTVSCAHPFPFKHGWMVPYFIDVGPGGSYKNPPGLLVFIVLIHASTDLTSIRYISFRFSLVSRTPLPYGGLLLLLLLLGFLKCSTPKSLKTALKQEKKAPSSDLSASSPILFLAPSKISQTNLNQPGRFG